MTEATDTETDAPVAHEHEHEGDGVHAHQYGDQPHTHELAEGEHAVQDPTQGYVPDPAVQAFCTTITLVVAHTNSEGPYEVVKRVTEQLEGLGLRGVVVGVAAVELRGDGGLIGL